MATIVSARRLAGLVGHWHGPGPAYRRLADGIRLLVLDGRLPLGARLPSERDLAEALGVSRTTVTAAYALLRDRSYLDSRRGAGSIVRVPGRAVGVGPVGLTPSGDDPDLLDLAVAALPAGSGVHQAYVEALEALPVLLPTTGYDLRGVPELRQTLAERWSGRGLPTEPEQVLVTSGAQHALALLLSVLVRPGDRVVVDHPTYPNALAALARVGARPVPVPVHPDSWEREVYAESMRTARPRLAYLVPDFHNPTGHTLDVELRTEVARLAERTGTVLVVDETLTDLWIDTPAPPPVAASAAGRGVVTIGGVGKSHWGGLRIGWIRADESLVQRLAAARVALDLGTPVLDQLAVDALLRAGDEPLIERRRLLRNRRDALRAALAARLPTWDVPLPGGGLSLWVEMDRAGSSALAASAARYGLRLAAGPLFGVDGAFERHLRLPYTLPEPDLITAVERLALAAEGVGFGRAAPTPWGPADPVPAA